MEKKQEHFIKCDEIIREQTTLKMRDGKELSAYIYRSVHTKKNAPAVLFLHGLGGFAQDFNFEPFLSTSALAGFRVFAYDYRNSGNSIGPGEKHIMKALSPELFEKIFEDAKEAMDWVYNSPDIDREKIIVMGASLGGTIAISSLLNDKRAKLIVAICTPYNFREVLEKHYINGPLVNRMIFKLIRRNIKDFDLDKFKEVAERLSPQHAIRDDEDYSDRVFLAQNKNDEVIPYSLGLPKFKEHMKLPDENVLTFEKGGHEFKGYVLPLFGRMLPWVYKKLGMLNN